MTARIQPRVEARPPEHMGEANSPDTALLAACLTIARKTLPRPDNEARLEGVVVVDAVDFDISRNI